MSNNSIKTIGVYCSSSAQINKSYFEAAKQLGTFIGQHGMNCCNGGGRLGLMGTISDAVMNHGSKAIGVIPGFIVNQK